jgi:hypothetical protein
MGEVPSGKIALRSNVEERLEEVPSWKIALRSNVEERPFRAA